MKFLKPGPDPKAPYQEMYVTLFKAVTAALYMMEDNEFMKARAVLIRAQQAADADAASTMQSITGGLNLGGLGL